MHRSVIRCVRAGVLALGLLGLAPWSVAQESLPFQGKLSLAQAVELANDRNSDINLSTIALRAAEAGVLSANVAPNPTLSISTENINPHQGIGAGSLRQKMVDTTLRVDQVIERGGKRELRTENANRLADASRGDLAEARRQLRSLVAAAYFDLLAAQERLVLTKETAGLFDATLAAAEKRKAAGDLAGAEVERLRVDALRARNDTRQAEADLRRARLALLLVMGVSTSKPDQLSASDNWPQPAAMPDLDDIDALLQRRPDVQAAAARVQAAQAQLRLAQSQRTRDVSVGAQYTHSPASPQNSFFASETYGVSVTVPLFVNNYFEGDIRTAAAGVDSAQTSLVKTKQEAGAELQRAWSDMQSAQDRLARFRDELTVSARRAVDAAEYAFRNGAISVTDVLDARRTWRAISLDELNARADYAKALAAWRAATLDQSKP